MGSFDVINTDPAYDIYSNMSDYTCPTFYAAANSEQFDSAAFGSERDLILVQDNILMANSNIDEDTDDSYPT